MSWLPALIGGGAAIGSALLGRSASRDAASAATQAADRSAQVQREMFDISRQDLAPFREAGVRALGTYEQNVNRPFYETPGYQFRFNEGTRAIDQNASARGLLNSGARLRELTRYGQGMAEQGYGEYLNRLGALSGVGQTATGQGVAAGQNAAAGIGNAFMQGGQAAAQGAINSGNATIGGLNNLVALYARGMFN